MTAPMLNPGRWSSKDVGNVHLSVELLKLGRIDDHGVGNVKGRPSFRKNTPKPRSRILGRRIIIPHPPCSTRVGHVRLATDLLLIPDTKHPSGLLRLIRPLSAANRPPGRPAFPVGKPPKPTRAPLQWFREHSQNESGSIPMGAPWKEEP